MTNRLPQPTRILAVNTAFIDIVGDFTGAGFLSQVVYWWKKSGRKPFYKFLKPCNHFLYKEGDSWTEELGLKISVVNRIVNRLRELNIIKTHTNIDRVTRYILQEDVLNRCLDFKGFHKLDLENGSNKSEFQTHINPESGFCPNTTEITSKITYKNYVRNDIENKKLKTKDTITQLADANSKQEAITSFNKEGLLNGLVSDDKRDVKYILRELILSNEFVPIKEDRSEKEVALNNEVNINEPPVSKYSDKVSEAVKSKPKGCLMIKSDLRRCGASREEINEYINQFIFKGNKGVSVALKEGLWNNKIVQDTCNEHAVDRRMFSDYLTIWLEWLSRRKFKFDSMRDPFWCFAFVIHKDWHEIRNASYKRKSA